MMTEKLEPSGGNVMVLDRCLDDWKAIRWHQVHRKVNRLRQRIYRASTTGDLKKVRNLQRLTIRSTANRLLAIRQVTQYNQGKRTAGIDGHGALQNETRIALYQQLQVYHPDQVRPVRRVYIPKANGKQRPLGIATIVDRCQQTMIQTALEPYWEAQFEATSYGFRPARSTHDAIRRVYLSVREGTTRQWMLEADIEGAFDNISHEHLLKELGNFPARRWIKRWLAVGIMEQGKWSATKTGTPQGGSISPLLMNIALHGMEKLLGVEYNRAGGVKAKCPYVVVRYADDCVVMARSKTSCQQAINSLNGWLANRGLRLSSEKTRIKHIEEGIDFLGVNIKMCKRPRHPSGKALHTKPSKASVKAFRKELCTVWKSVLNKPLERAITQLNAKVLGWGNYYRPYMSKRLFGQLDHWMWKRQTRYRYRRRPHKSWQWCKQGYRGKIPSRQDNWVFMNPQTGQYLYKLSWIPIYRHSLVKGRYSPDAPNLKDYWAKRQQTRIPYGIKVRMKLWKRQKGQCILCQSALDNGEALHVHHIKARSKGGGDELSNLCILHEVCHKQLHSRYGKKLKPLPAA